MNLKAIKEIVTCGVCKSVMRNPKNLPCAHAFCRDCIDQFHDAQYPTNDAKCPICRQRFVLCYAGAERLPDNIYLKNLIDGFEKTCADDNASSIDTKCNDCDDRAGSKFCFGCNADLCDRCSENHTTPLHHIYDKSSLDEAEQKVLKQMTLDTVRCEEHNLFPNRYCFNKDCVRLVCPECCLQHHRDHTSKLLTECAPLSREQMQQSSEKARLLEVDVRNEVARCELLRSKVMKEKDIFSTNVAVEFKRLREKLGKHEDEILGEGLVFYDDKQSKLEEKINRLSSKGNVLKDTVANIKAIQSVGTDAYIVSQNPHFERKIAMLENDGLNAMHTDLNTNLNLEKESNPERVLEGFFFKLKELQSTKSCHDKANDEYSEVGTANASGNTNSTSSHAETHYDIIPTPLRLKQATRQQSVLSQQLPDLPFHLNERQYLSTPNLRGMHEEHSAYTNLVFRYLKDLTFEKGEHITCSSTISGFETDVLGEDHIEILNMLKEANKDFTGVHLSLYRDSKDNAVIIGYNTTMSMNKIEIPEKYNGRLRIKNPRNVNDEALIASQYALENRIKLDHQQQDILQSCIARYSSQLWENHSNLTMISGDRIKYTGGFPTERFCVVLYCLSKGFRPFKEDLFPTSLQEKGQDIPVDVREGYFLFGPIDLVGRVSQWNDPVCMGSSIGNKRDYKTGSVGLFVDLPNNLMGFITCCHVLFDCIGMVSLDKCYKEPDRRKKEDDAYFTVQPSLPSFCGIDKDERICGFVERAVFKPESAPVSVDAALVRITRRIPKTGHFTIRDNTQINEAGYSPKLPPLYNGGKILCQIQSEEREKPLIKSGTTTGLTKGEFKMNGLEVSIPEDGAFLGDSAIYSPKRAMKGQYEIRSSMTFFDLGDSGSAVFLKNPDGSLKCVGMAIGRTSYYTTVVTPIGAILQALGLQEKNVTNFGEPMDLD